MASSTSPFTYGAVEVIFGSIYFYFHLQTAPDLQDCPHSTNLPTIPESTLESNQESKSDDSGPFYNVTERCEAVREVPKDVLKMASGLISPSGHRGQLCNGEPVSYTHLTLPTIYSV